MPRLLALMITLAFAAAMALFAPGHGHNASAGITSPAAFYMGSILVDGAAPATSNFIYAEKWNGQTCGVGTVYVSSTTPKTAFYMITVNSEDTQSGCFETGDPIIFKFKGMKAPQIPMWNNWGAQVVDLTFKSTKVYQCSPALCPLVASPIIVPPPTR